MMGQCYRLLNPSLGSLILARSMKVMVYQVLLSQECFLECYSHCPEVPFSCLSVDSVYP